MIISYKVLCCCVVVAWLRHRNLYSSQSHDMAGLYGSLSSFNWHWPWYRGKLWKVHISFICGRTFDMEHVAGVSWISWSLMPVQQLNHGAPILMRAKAGLRLMTSLKETIIAGSSSRWSAKLRYTGPCLAGSPLRPPSLKSILIEDGFNVCHSTPAEISLANLSRIISQWYSCRMHSPVLLYRVIGEAPYSDAKLEDLIQSHLFTLLA